MSPASASTPEVSYRLCLAVPSYSYKCVASISETIPHHSMGQVRGGPLTVISSRKSESLEIRIAVPSDRTKPEHGSSPEWVPTLRALHSQFNIRMKRE
jgi:hypothetical protein